MERPGHVGILAMEVYIPSRKVLQQELEEQDGCSGKYTSGLGQISMSFCGDNEDPVSMALTAVHGLMEKHGLGPGCIGRLEVGTESGLDRSKSIKSHICQLFAAAGNTSMEGVDCMHGCYGATAALLNSAAWIECSAWDGRLAVVVATDIALYAPGSAARATGGCGAVALLVGPDAPLALDPAWRSCFSDHAEDFCKPVGLHSPYPLVDGPATLHNLLRAADGCYSGLRAGLRGRGSRSSGDAAAGPLSCCQHFVCHAPFNKMVRKVLSRLYFQDLLLQRQHQDMVQNGTSAGPTGLPAAGAAAAAAAAAGPHGCAAEPAGPASEASSRAAAAAAQAAAPAATPGPRVPAAAAAAAAALAGSRVSSPSAAAAAAAAALVRAQAPASPASAVSAALSGLGLAAPAAPSSPAAAGAAAPAAAGAAAAAAGAVGPGSSRHVVDACGVLQQLDEQWRRLNPDSMPSSSYSDRTLEQALLQVSQQVYDEKAALAAEVQRQVGNTYTASLWMGVAGAVEALGPALVGQRLLLFSYGSGAMASLICLVGRVPAGSRTVLPAGQRNNSNSSSSNGGGIPGTASRNQVNKTAAGGLCTAFSLQSMAEKLRIRDRIASQRACRPSEYDAASELVQQAYCSGSRQYVPSAGVEDLRDGTYFLAGVDEHGRRAYRRKGA